MGLFPSKKISVSLALLLSFRPPPELGTQQCSGGFRLVVPPPAICTIVVRGAHDESSLAQKKRARPPFLPSPSPGVLDSAFLTGK